MELNVSLIADALPLLLEGALVTVKITVISVGLGMLIGLFAGIARIAQFAPVRALAAVYVDFIRGTPLLVQIFIIYFALPMITGMRIDPLIAAVTACSINSGAYVAEIFRAGIESIDKGQMEAGRSTGLTQTQTMLYVIWPQAFRRMLPPLTNQCIISLKDTSLLVVIGVGELTRQGQEIIAVNFRAFEVWLTVALFYLAMTLSISAVLRSFERRLALGGRSAPVVPAVPSDPQA